MADENTIVFYFSPVSLSEMALSKLALVCWRQQVADLYPDVARALWAKWFTEHEFSISDSLQLPSLIQNLVDNRIGMMGQKLERCFNNLERCFEEKLHKFVLIYLEYAILDSNGEICLKRTAKNLLSSGRLNPVDEYKLACAYYLEEDIERLWPSVLGDRSIPFEYEYSRYPSSLYYWTFRLRNRLNEIPGDKQKSAEFRILSSLEIPMEWPEVEYYWSRITSRQRKSQMNVIFQEKNDVIVKYLLPKLSKEELQYVLQKATTPTPAVILCSLAAFQSHCDLVLQAWNFMKWSINVKQFMQVLSDLQRYSNQDLSGRTATLLHDIWTSAPDDLKNKISNYMVTIFFRSISIKRVLAESCGYGRNAQIYLDLITKVESESRKTLWLENWRKLIMVVNVSDLKKLMNLCFENGTDMAQFKEHHMMNYEMPRRLIRSSPYGNSLCTRRYFDAFIKKGLCDELIEYLKFCSSDEERVRNLMRVIVDTNKPSLHQLKFNALVKFKAFIVSSFASAELANEFIKNMISKKVESWYDFLDKGCLNKAKNLFECFLSSEPDLLAEAKQKCFERCQIILKRVTFRVFYPRVWQQFLKWCVASEEDLTMFKKSFPIDDVFNILLNKATSGQLIPVGFDYDSYAPMAIPLEQYHTFSMKGPDDVIVAGMSSVNNFLLWLFESYEVTQAFKLKKINDYKNASAIVCMFNWEKRTTIGFMLNWFFDNHDAERDIFLAKNRHIRERLRSDFLRWSESESETEDEETDEETDEMYSDRGW
ncbi:uncharacterized protein LOC135831321 [Planococcus citri]|uniref:uncharacterized protein LOC135831321 n=1 Tax=Planococcus citri TaxID=170843 RepID=UPI0031F8E217